MPQNKLKKLFTTWSKEEVVKVTPLAESGSDRKYFRIFSENHSTLGVYNADAKENLAFIEFTKHFQKKGLKVPEILAEEVTENIYLIEDLGDTTLFAFLTNEHKTSSFSKELQQKYYQVLDALPEFQIIGGEGLNYSLCYPRSSFDKQSMMWDLNYFKYYFLKLAQIPFEEQALEDDYQKFTDYLLKANQNYFLYRDFQSRNIMVKNDEVYFIDYQGGRKGALQYDLASLLYDAKAEIPQEKREELYTYYIGQLKKHININEEEFKKFFQGYVLIRIMQAMGAYGFRGFYEKKAHFLASIPPALANLDNLLKTINLPVELPTLMPLLKKLINSEKLMELAAKGSNLEVSVNSFSYKRGIPVDESGHGGGFAFDCRALHNPGRYDEYKQLTGMDMKVIEFLDKEEDVAIFKKNVTALVEQSVEKYIERNFDHLSVNFGCTGGQHRSVYMAEFITRQLRDKYNIKVEVRHREQEMKR
ncbi:MAG: phosphotransferase enzyme family protein [Bacteroidetes bacterium]|nr:MAG: phosphotransferase enzyme family protein [Bacteroidota bacterium]